MRLEVDAKQLPPMEFYSRVSVKKEKLRLKSRRDERGIDHPVLDEEGRVIYRTELYLIVENDEGDQRADQSITVAIINAVDLKMGQPYVLKGKVSVVHWLDETAGRMKVSLTAEGVVPQSAASASQDKPSA